MSNKNLYAIGVMSGTSLDGIDLSYVSSDGKSSYNHKCSSFFKFRESTRKQVDQFITDFTISKKTLAYVNYYENLITEDYINAIMKFIKYQNIKKIDLIAIHGQTIFHSSKLKSSIQLCNSDYIAKKFKKIVISNFRQNDLLNNGEGAPLVPIFHKLLLNKFKLQRPSCFINIGGISNLTLLNNDNNLYAYDIGPGMCLLDKYVFLKRKKLYDNNGYFSLKGRIDQKALNTLQKDKFFKKKPPKSLDRNYFSIKPVLKLEFNDACSTLSAFTAYAIINDIRKFMPKNIILSGGGVRNKFLFNLIKENFEIPVISIEQIFGSAKFIESQAFAYLGIRRLKRLPISYPKTTGVKRPTIGGKIF